MRTKEGSKIKRDNPPPRWGKKKRNTGSGGIFKKALPAALAAVLLGAAAAATAAYLSLPLDSRVNQINLGAAHVDIIEEKTPDPGSAAAGADGKHVQLSYPAGPGYVPGVARARIVPVAAEGEYLTDGNFSEMQEPAGDEIALGDIVIYLAGDWPQNWFYKDGFFYYNKVLYPGEITPLLVAGVDYANAQDYNGVKIHINVLADILQAAGGAPEEAWGVNVNGDLVTE
ncbi:MAG: hypothetical protein FWC55_10620 [Firmicutes bacterium]|nr:hypothetical protein [Bacillota bacterium]